MLLFWDNYWLITATSDHLWLWEIQKIWDFQYFWANFATFFFKIRFWKKLVLEPLKMVFLTFFRSWRWFIQYRFLIHFWAFKVLSFCVFFMLKSVVFASFDATWEILPDLHQIVFSTNFQIYKLFQKCCQIDNKFLFATNFQIFKRWQKCCQSGNIFPKLENWLQKKICWSTWQHFCQRLKIWKLVAKTICCQAGNFDSAWKFENWLPKKLLPIRHHFWKHLLLHVFKIPLLCLLIWCLLKLKICRI